MAADDSRDRVRIHSDLRRVTARLRTHRTGDRLFSRRDSRSDRFLRADVQGSTYSRPLVLFANPTEQRKRQRRNAAFCILKTLLDKHLVSWSAVSVAAAASEQNIETCAQALQDAGNLAYRRNHRVMYELGGSFHFVHGAADQFVGANHLQTGTIHYLSDRTVDPLHLRLQLLAS